VSDYFIKGLTKFNEQAMHQWHFPLLQIVTVATGSKPLWPQASGPSLILHRYNGSIVVMGRSRPSLLWSIPAMDANVTVPVAAVTSTSKGRLTSDCLPLLVFIAAISNLTSAYPIAPRQIQIWTYADIHKYRFIKL
jgi:hypothetical protein